MPALDAIQLSPNQTGAAPTPEQKRFNTLVRQLERARKTLADWAHHAPRVVQAHLQVHEPLVDEAVLLRRQWVAALDAASQRQGWTTKERRTLGELILEAVAELLDGGPDDEALKAMYSRHADADFDAEQAESLRAVRAYAEQHLGLDLGDDADSLGEPELRARIHAQLDDKMRADAAADADSEAQRPKTGAQRRREDLAQQARQSVRDVFRKLASAIHPDREPDEAIRRTKTELMQRANQAHAGNDLLTLLELQAQVAVQGLGATAGAAADAVQVKHFNRVLADQLDEMKMEIRHVEAAFRMDFDLGLGASLNPLRLDIPLDGRTKLLRQDIDRTRQELGFFDNVAVTKRWLKRMHQDLMTRQYEESPFFD